MRSSFRKPAPLRGNWHCVPSRQSSRMLYLSASPRFLGWLRSADGTLAEVPKNVSANILEAPASLLLVVQRATRLFSPTKRRAGQADFRCRPAAGFFAAVSFDCFLPAIGINISCVAARLQPN